MEFTASTPRINLKVLDLAITAPAPYTAGHTLTESEAKFLNRQVATAVANPIPAMVKRQVEAAVAAKPGSTAADFQPQAAAIQAFYDTRYAEYVPGAVNRGESTSTSTDPVAKFSHSIAAEKVKELLKANGKNIREVMSAKDAEGKSVFHKLVAQYLAANPWIVDLAKAQAAAMQSAAGDLDFGDTAEVAPKPQAEPKPTPSE